MAFALRLVLLLCGITGSCSFVLYTDQCCPKGWIQLNDRCLHFVGAEFSFEIAETFCNILGGNLVSIHSRLENEMVRHLIMTETGSFEPSWIGFNDLDLEGEFVWTDGSTVDFTDWANNRPRTNANLNCVEINFRGETWNDRGCRAGRPSVCARPAKY
uniref:galactose-specific lectin nattectin-like n=1 Tax=Doryrhamphus excisus TaxID=161450 RepID=UPI0025ADB494|nr:galactose-specific lectin nattectin-like [Doryrhamphus excisus]